MSEVELILLNEGRNCTLYTIQFISDDEAEYEKFYNKFIEDAKLNQDLLKIVQVIDNIAEKGALERYFRYEGKVSDSVVALPTLSSKLRLYCLRLSDGILILGNGGIKKSQTYEEDDSLRGYVLDLQTFERILKEEVKAGNVVITERKIETDQTFEI
ncbi:MAG: hypothetical protein J1E97_00885 [Muribaculaceae bacterium]|nr:hypothetical protein [Muribaculaceae bacterium]